MFLKKKTLEAHLLSKYLEEYFRAAGPLTHIIRVRRYDLYKVKHLNVKYKKNDVFLEIEIDWNGKDETEKLALKSFCKLLAIKY